MADASIEVTGDVLGPIEAALADPSVGVCGPFGIVTEDLRAFEPSDGPEVDAIEGYLMAFRRETLAATELFDEKFRWYRTADIELSFRIKDADLRAIYRFVRALGPAGQPAPDYVPPGQEPKAPYVTFPAPPK